MRIKVNLLGLALLLAVVGALIGAYCSSDMVRGAVAGAVYGFIAGLASFIGLIPIAGPIICWFLLSLIKTVIPLANQGLFIVVDIIAIIISIWLTMIAFVLLLISRETKRATPTS